MSVALSQLEEQILAVLCEKGELSLPQLVEHLGKNGSPSVDMPQVRDAVWQLIHKGQADFTPAPLPYSAAILTGTSEQLESHVYAIVADSIASMTDQQALRLYHRLTGLSQGSVLDPIVT